VTPVGESDIRDYPALHRYFGAKASQYDSARFRNLRGRTVDALEWLLLRRALARLARSGQSVWTVVDVPVGTGRMAKRMTDRGMRVTGVDASADMLALAQGKRAAEEYVVGRAELLPFGDASFDAVVSVRLFGHLPPAAKSEALREFRRVSRKGAIVFFPGTTRLLELRRRWQKLRGRPLGQWNPLSPDEMASLARDAGLQVSCILRLLRPIAETWAAVLRSSRVSGSPAALIRESPCVALHERRHAHGDVGAEGEQRR
jgi:ubiquinone/menaquinone biosynthesis C-methylase UbiE